MSSDDLRQVEARLDKRIDDVTKTVSTLGTEVAANREGLRQAREIADRARAAAEATQHEASVVFEAIKTHNRLLENRIASFEKTLNDVSEENRVQTSTLADLAAEAAERTRASTELQMSMNKLTLQLTTMQEVEAKRNTEDAVEKALKAEQEKRQEIMWKRLPVYLSLAVIMTGLLNWYISSQAKRPEQVYIQQAPQSQSQPK